MLSQIVRLIESISDDAHSNTNEGPSISRPSTSSTTVTTPATTDDKIAEHKSLGRKARY